MEGDLDLSKDWDSFYSDNEVIVPYLDVCVFAVRNLKKVTASMTIYEFGVGNANNLKFLRQKFPNVRLLGSDISEVTIEKLQSESIPNSKFWVNDRSLNIPQSDIDLVLERGSIQHVPKELAVCYVKEMHDAMKIGGQGYFEIASTSHGMYGTLGASGYDPVYGYRTFYSFDEIMNLFSDFKIKKIHHLNRELYLDSSLDSNIFKTYAQGSWQVEVEKKR